MPSGEIDGLVWEPQSVQQSEDDALRVSLPTLRPVNIIFKGDKPFTYGHYGVHLGQEDCLIFLGPPDNTITGYFIDCREDSSTRHNRVVVRFSPDPTRALRIPPGVAHTFDTTGVFSVNKYRVFLPDPGPLLSGQSEWTIEGDIVNVPMGLRDDELPRFKANRHPASELFYDLVRRLQLESLANLEHQYPATEDITFGNGETKRIKFWKKLEQAQRTAAWSPIDGITDAGWAGHLVVWTGTDVGYVPVLSKRPLEVRHERRQRCSHDFTIHLDRDEHFTILGPSTTQIVVRLVDCRPGSPTFGGETVERMHPSALRQLVIPRGVAHTLEADDDIFVVNSPAFFLRDDGSLDTADPLHWSPSAGPPPSVTPYSRPAGLTEYEMLAESPAANSAVSLQPVKPSELPQVVDTPNREVVPLKPALTLGGSSVLGVASSELGVTP